MNKVIGPALTRLLIKEGLIPDNCLQLKVIIYRHSVIRLRYTVMLDETQAAAFHRAFAELTKKPETT